MSNNCRTKGEGKLQLESRWGWSDFRTGRTFHPDYDGWSPQQQRNYENGRLRAANVLAAFGKVPAQQTIHVYAAAAEKIGYVEPVTVPRW